MARTADDTSVEPPTAPSRDLAVSVFVVWRGAVLLHRHRRLGLWLPPGGHVEPDELPDDAAVREVLEEAGLAVRLVGEPAITAPGPRQLVRPRGVQLESIAPGHEHVDLVYLGVPVEPYDGVLGGDEPSCAWLDAAAAAALDLTAEIRAWVSLALDELSAA